MTTAELRRVAVILTTVAEAEVARIEGDDARVVSLLDSIDPVEAFGLANRATFDAGVRAIGRRIERSVRTVW